MAEPAWLPLIPGYLPWELARRHQWMCWTPEPRQDGKGWSKPPRDPRTGIKADKTDPAAWGTIYEAIDGMHRHGLAGVGFCVTAADRLTFADLDHCRDAESGAIDADALAIVAELASFAELSPSGTGVRIITIGTLPPGGRRKKGIELYDSDTFLTLTGHHLTGTPWTVHDRTAELAALHARIFPPAPVFAPPRIPVPAGRVVSADRVLEKARRAANGGKFEALFCADPSYIARHYPKDDGSPDYSAADSALCRMLSYWTREDSSMIDSLFRQSRLYRPKWDVVHDGTRTYGEMTIDYALHGRRT